MSEEAHYLLQSDEIDVMWKEQMGFPVLHMVLKTKWTHNNKKKLLAGLYTVRQMFGDDGFDYIYTFSPYADDKLLKFHISIGFEPWMYITDESGNRLHTLSRQPTIKGEI